MTKDIERLTENQGLGSLVEFRGKVSLDEYKRLLEISCVGLCLKLSSGDLHDSTFPSKVMEYASHSLLLISTPVSDVPQIFNGHAILLENDSAENLADALAWLVRNPEEAEQYAQSARNMVAERFSMETVGDRLLDFLTGDEL